MKKRHISVLMMLILTTLLYPITLTVSAEDLPIDITSIGRHDATESHITTRIAADLFTADSMRINDAMAEKIRIRQSVASYLFAQVSRGYEVELHTQLVNVAYSLALFSEPTNISNVTLPQPARQLSLWLLVPIIALGATGGFIWALVSKAKKKGSDMENSFN